MGERVEGAVPQADASVAQTDSVAVPVAATPAPEQIAPTLPHEVVADAPSPAKVEVVTSTSQPAAAREEPVAVPVMTKQAEEMAPAPAPEPVVAAPSPAISAPAVVAAASAAPAPAVETKIDARALLSDAGLVMVETDPSKPSSYQLEDEPVKLGRPRRVRQAPAAPEELRQVETKN